MDIQGAFHDLKQKRQAKAHRQKPCGQQHRGGENAQANRPLCATSQHLDQFPDQNADNDADQDREGAATEDILTLAELRAAIHAIRDMEEALDRPAKAAPEPPVELASAKRPAE